ncbi:hypothetical protein E2C01_072985 [Portunus trituberculatus]|uniref:Uncharacterized protein n=1 Tax=Portunus trituberculatus TaxID=210409 RepID=A0A5B7IC51_PORTR|nr:hypothetical protein [Portunus trituberculatus]
MTCVAAVKRRRGGNDGLLVESEWPESTPLTKTGGAAREVRQYSGSEDLFTSLPARRMTLPLLLGNVLVVFGVHIDAPGSRSLPAAETSVKGPL